MKWTTLKIAGVAVALISANAGSAQNHANPAYQMWAVWREGATVTLKTESVVDGKTESRAEHKQTLKSVSAEKAVIEFTMAVDADGTKYQMPAQTMDILAKVPEIKLPPNLPKSTKAAAPPPAKSKETKGREALTINGRKLECEWTQTEDPDGTVTKIWLSDEVPGRTVKVVTRNKQGTDTSIVVDWKGTKK